MKRIPEPELMDDVEQARAYAAADFAEPHQRCIELLRERFPSRNPASALELGCGAGDICIRFARAFPQSIVHGIDGAEAMLACGREAVRASGLADRVELVRGYLPDEAPPLAEYELVFSNSRPHQNTTRQQVAMTAPVVVDHGRVARGSRSRQAAAGCCNGLLVGTA